MSSGLAAAKRLCPVIGGSWRQMLGSPEVPGVEVDGPLADVSHPIGHDALAVLDNLRHVLAYPREHIWGTAAQGIHVLKEVSLEK